MTHKDWQKVYDVIKLLRQEDEGLFEVILYGKKYLVEKWKTDTQYTDGYCQDVLCKYGKGRAQKIGITTINWKDAGPNPRLLCAQRGFIPLKNIYGVVKRESNIECEGQNVI